MTPACTSYTLVGFSAEIDWRPLHFVKPIPPTRVCGACGVVRPNSALLPCMHVLCESCYDQCASTNGSHVCPFDDHEWQDDDIEWRAFPVAELLRREVRCWNEEHGCQCVTPASGIAQHFHRECAHHSVSCPKCCGTVPCSGVIAHLKSGLCNSGTTSASDSQLHSGLEKERAFITLFRGCLEKQIADVKELLVRILGDITTHGDRLNEISHGVNSSKETLRQELADGAKQNENRWTQIMSRMEASNRQLELLCGSADSLNLSASMLRLEKILREEVANAARESQHKLSEIATAIEAVRAGENENSQKALAYIQNINRRSEQCVALCTFFVTNVESLQETAMKQGWARYESQQVYLRGYCISPGVYLEKDGETTKLKASLRLHKGEMDDSLVWPFEHTIKLCVVHPIYGEERVVQNKTSRSFDNYQKPTTASNEAVKFSKETLDMKSLIADGYVEKNQLRIKFELLP
ncbi:TNF receptor-associated factor 6-like [Amblyomma americanum]